MFLSYLCCYFILFLLSGLRPITISQAHKEQPKFSPNQASRLQPQQAISPSSRPIRWHVSLQSHGPARTAHQASQAHTQARESGFFLFCFSLAQACSLPPACMCACSSPNSTCSEAYVPRSSSSPPCANQNSTQACPNQTPCSCPDHATTAPRPES